MNEIILPIHIGSVILSVLLILRADSLGMSWLRGKVDTLDKGKIHFLHKALWCTLGLVVLTGISLFLPLLEFLLTQEQFYLKMFFVGVLIINGLAIGQLNNVSTEIAFKNVDRITRAKLLLAGVISTTAWIGAIICGLFLYA